MKKINRKELRSVCEENTRYQGKFTSANYKSLRAQALELRTKEIQNKMKKTK